MSDQDKGQALPFKLLDLDELGELADRESAGWLVENLLPLSGVCLVIGAPLAGKTTLLAAISAAVATGTPFAGRATSPGTVVWIEAEQRVKKFHDLFSNAMRAVGEYVGSEIPLKIVAPRGFSLDDDNHVEHLCSMLDKEKAVLVVLDSMRRLSSFDENRSNETAEVMRRITLLTGDYKRLVIVVHHTGKNGLPRGSTDLVAASDSILRVDKASNEMLKLHACHHDAPESVWKLRAERTDETLSFVQADSSEQKTAPGSRKNRDTEIRSAIINVLKAETPLSLSKLRNAVRRSGVAASNGAIDAAVSSMATDGLVDRSDGARGASLYALAIDAGLASQGPKAPDMSDDVDWSECP